MFEAPVPTRLPKLSNDVSVLYLNGGSLVKTDAVSNQTNCMLDKVKLSK